MGRACIEPARRAEGIMNREIKFRAWNKSTKKMATTSPLPKKTETLDFPSAMREVMNGRRIRRQEWEDEATHCTLHKGMLLIHQNGENRGWVISDGDMEGQDWVVI